jgi:hypothetical protein
MPSAPVGCSSVLGIRIGDATHSIKVLALTHRAGRSARAERSIYMPRPQSSNNDAIQAKTGLSQRRLNSDPAWQRICELHTQRFCSQ